MNKSIFKNISEFFKKQDPFKSYKEKEISQLLIKILDKDFEAVNGTLI